MELKGRKKIFTSEKEINKSNLFKVIRESMTVHEQNREAIQFLLRFDKGEQPLVREKTVRPEINIVSTSNLANEITEFKLGYFWGNPIALVQKSDKLPNNSDKETDNDAITLLNNMYYSEYKDSKDQQLARYVEICGIGYQMIDIKRDQQKGESAFDLITLNPMFTFIVYSDGVKQEPLMAVTYTQKADFSKTYTCITRDRVYIVDSHWKIVNGKKESEEFANQERSGEANPFGRIYIVEFERAFDRTGCFERQIDELNALNILESDLVNDVAQNTQAIWWGNDIQLEEDESGEPTGVKGGQWILTNTTSQGSKPDIKALVLNYNYQGVLSNIQAKHDYILERAYVPKQSDPGGGSTTGAMSLSSGWSAAEQVACKESLVLKKSFQERNKLALIAVNKSIEIPEDSPLKKLDANDIEIRFIRQKTFDMNTKVNSLATMIKIGVDVKTAMSAIDFFPNLAEAIADSQETMEKYQESQIQDKTTEDVTSNNNNILENSPLKDL